MADFLDSLVDAVARYMSDATQVMYGASNPQAGPSAFADTLSRLGDKPVNLGVPEHQGIQGIRASDPDFDLATFLVRVGEMFAAYHEAFDRGDLTPARRFVDERAYSPLAAAAEASGRRPEGPRALTTRAIKPITARHEDGLDLVRVFITAEQAGADELLCEYWELIRKRGTLTKPGLDLTHCPNCGGPVDGKDPTRCDYCDTRLADPALDWVVRKITAQ